MRRSRIPPPTSDTDMLIVAHDDQFNRWTGKQDAIKHYAADMVEVSGAYNRVYHLPIYNSKAEGLKLIDNPETLIKSLYLYARVNKHRKFRMGELSPPWKSSEIKLLLHSYEIPKNIILHHKYLKNKT